MTRTFYITFVLSLGLVTAGCEVKVTKPTPAQPVPQTGSPVSKVKIDGYSIEVQTPSLRSDLREGHGKLEFGDHQLDLELASGKLIVDGAGLGNVSRQDQIQVTAQGAVLVNGAERKVEKKVGKPHTDPAAKTPAKKEVPPVAPASVTLTGRGASFLQLFNVNVAMKTEEAAQKKLVAALRQITATAFKVDDKTNLVVALPASTISFLDAVQKMFNRPVAVAGWLTTTDDTVLIAASGTKGARQVPLLVADTLTFLDESNRAKFPAENTAVVEGLALKGTFKAGSHKIEWAFENADGRILLLLPTVAKAPENRARIKAAGMLIFNDGQALLKATKVDVLKNP